MEATFPFSSSEGHSNGHFAYRPPVSPGAAADGDDLHPHTRGPVARHRFTGVPAGRSRKLRTGNAAGFFPVSPR